MTDTPRQPVIITSCGPSMKPYWRPLVDRGYTLVFTQEQTGKWAQRVYKMPAVQTTRGERAPYVSAFMPSVTKVVMWNVIGTVVDNAANVMGGWSEIFKRFQWGSHRKRYRLRHQLRQRIWNAVNTWTTTRMSISPDGDVPIDMAYALRYDMLQHIYGRLQEQDGVWGCDASNWLIGYVIDKMTELVPNLIALDAMHTFYNLDIKAMLIHEDITCDMAPIVMWAKVRGIPTIHIAHGNYGYRPEHEVDGASITEDVHSYLLADHMLAWNERQREFIIRGGARPEQIHLTGHANTDGWVNMTMDKEGACAGLGFDPFKPVVFYIGSMRLRLNPDEPDNIERGFVDFLAAMKLLPEWQVLVRPHPGRHVWDAKWFENILRHQGVDADILRTDENKIAGIHAADVFFAPQGSMLSTEVAILGKPTVMYEESIDNIESYRGGDLTEFYVPCDHTPEGIAAALKMARGIEHTAQWQQARNAIIYDEYYICDGHALERGMEVIESIIRGHEEAKHDSNTE